MGGDMNSSFFHRSVRIRRYHNSITHLTDHNGRECFDSHSIDNMLVGHFNSLWNNPDARPLNWFLKALPPDLPTLSSDQQLSLTRPVTKDEIYTNFFDNAVMPRAWVGKEQSGFVSSHSPVDNIIAVQEMIHSINYEKCFPRRMLVKVDIEKAYDTLNWKPSDCLVALNLVAILNKARSLDLIPGFSSRLRNNFNHLMYADDLMLVSAASRKSARNICFCLTMYAHLTGQFPNKLKSEIYFPEWFNNQVSTRICKILNFRLGKVPFTYLGVLISHKRLATAHFDSMINRMNLAIAEWDKAHLSKAGKSILINSILMASPIYYLSVYPIPDTVLTKLSSIVRKFLWANSDLGKGMPLVSWDTVTSCKSEGGLGIRNLLKVKHSLMAKNLFNFLNKQDALWVDILYLKYGDPNFWSLNTPPNCSAFFKGLNITAYVLKTYLWIKTLNLVLTSFWHHPWMFDIPITFKPVFINMDLNLDNLKIDDLLTNSSLNLNALNTMFGFNWDSPILSYGEINTEENNHWIWFPASQGNKITASVYTFPDEQTC
ncbi:uncharacterized protein LOC120263608 [Dioscorea cayenensis subsp. rotundata]|uniref:Uncharacterized protein LOC120263608 n=1 Tax=Dioscorea cayennensis subsp. rotundata TaxID=55577 RepID=A0AB40BKD6_DIOCR|nr:uncharacterized protein LOC120263608 [Dioscorea cayenensis subsp. rotundata]